jgi:hypothetical protein
MFLQLQRFLCTNKRLHFEQELRDRHGEGRIITYIVTCLKFRPLWSSGYHAYHWNQGSRVQTRQRTMDF